MKTSTLITLALGLFGVVIGMILGDVYKSEIMPPSDGGSETLESFDPSKGSGRMVKTDKLTSTPLQWPKTYTAPDGVNTITERGDGTGSMTLAWVPKSKPSEAVVTESNRRLTMFAEMPTPNVLYDNRGFRAHVITQAEAEEVVRLLADHAGNLESFLEQLRQERRTDDAAKISADMSLAKATLAKWRKRVEEGKP